MKKFISFIPFYPAVSISLGLIGLYLTRDYNHITWLRVLVSLLVISGSSVIAIIVLISWFVEAKKWKNKRS